MLDTLTTLADIGFGAMAVALFRKLQVVVVADAARITDHAGQLDKLVEVSARHERRLEDHDQRLRALGVRGPV